jgi:peptide methionine sulfoxide reductase msrA/msrB
MKVTLHKELSAFEEHVIVNKGTEAPGTGEYLNRFENGTYHCKNCSASLYTSDAKFESHCGWPSFDHEIKGSVQHIPDADGRRTEIVCNACKAHLGHVFEGEGYTPLSLRHCVNSISMLFKPAASKVSRALVASGCFWGTEYHFAKAKGVLQTAVGYAGGHVQNPTYKQVCQGNTGHLEVVEILYNAENLSYENLLKLFFETHDFSQVNGQGPDIGSQYLSAVFYETNEEKAVIQKVIETLESKGHKVATQVRPMSPFFVGEEYHQKHYFKEAQTPYCHVYRKIF